MTSISLVKYIVLKEGRRCFTLQGIFPKNELARAKSHAIHIAESDNSHTLVCEVLEEHRKRETEIKAKKETK